MSKGCLTKWIMNICMNHAVFRMPRWLEGRQPPGWLELFNHCFGIGVWFEITSLNYFSKRSRVPEPLYRTSSPQRWIESNPWRRFILGFESLAFLVVEKDVTSARPQRVEMSWILSSGWSIICDSRFSYKSMGLFPKQQKTFSSQTRVQLPRSAKRDLLQAPDALFLACYWRFLAN